MFTIELSPGVYVGEVPGVATGSTFADRRSLHDAGVHRGLIQGIARAGLPSCSLEDTMTKTFWIQ